MAIGSYTTYENSPTNAPDTHNRHTVACMHRFFYILRRPPELAVWFMSKSRAVASEHARIEVDLTIVSSSFEMAPVMKGLYNALSIMLYNPLTAIESYTTHENSPTNTPYFATIAGAFWLACTQQTHCGMHASIFSHSQAKWLRAWKGYASQTAQFAVTQLPIQVLTGLDNA